MSQKVRDAIAEREDKRNPKRKPKAEKPAEEKDAGSGQS